MFFFNFVLIYSKKKKLSPKNQIQIDYTTSSLDNNLWSRCTGDTVINKNTSLFHATYCEKILLEFKIPYIQCCIHRTTLKTTLSIFLIGWNTQRFNVLLPAFQRSSEGTTNIRKIQTLVSRAAKNKLTMMWKSRQLIIEVLGGQT